MNHTKMMRHISVNSYFEADADIIHGKAADGLPVGSKSSVKLNMFIYD